MRLRDSNIIGNFKKKSIISFAVWGVLVAVWFFISNQYDISSVFLPKPQDVVKDFYSLVINGYGTNQKTLFVHLGVSMKRLLVSFILSILFAVPLGFLSASVGYISAIVDPFIEFYRSLPPLAYYTFLILWFGISEESKIALLLLAGFPPIFISCVSGVKRININLIHASRMLGANRIQTFKNVVIPAALPDIFTGLKTAIGVEYTTLISAEMVAAKAGIGWMVYDASNWMKTSVVFVGIIMMGVTGILLNILLGLIERKIVFWKGK